MAEQSKFSGPWAALPVPWTDEDSFDEAAFRADVASCCEAGIPGICSGMPAGEFYAMELDEFKQINKTMIEECQPRAIPTMVGCTATYTEGAMLRAEWAANSGANAIQVGLPFWMEVGEEQVVGFFRDVSRACGHITLSIFETKRHKKALTLAQHQAIKEAVPNYEMVAVNEGALGHDPEGCKALSEFVTVFADEQNWARLGPCGVRGSCSELVYWNPPVFLGLGHEMHEGNWDQVEQTCEKLRALREFIAAALIVKGLTETAFARIGGRLTGFLRTGLRNRGPYPAASVEDVKQLQGWCTEYFPELMGAE
jgi:dihydrodipicolinate synthase/N-acetylneuraminate lyase